MSEHIPWPGPPRRVLFHLFPAESSFHRQRSWAFFQPQPVWLHWRREGTLYVYGDADGFNEWLAISRSMIPLLSNPPPGVTWPEQTTIVTRFTWLFTLLKWGLAFPGFPLFIARYTTELHIDGWTHPITSALNLRLAGIHGITVLLNAEPMGARLQGDPVTLQQMAAFCRVSKRTLEHHLEDETLPRPDYPSKGKGKGKAHVWEWATVREPLERIVGRPMPEQYPKW